MRSLSLTALLLASTSGWASATRIWSLGNFAIYVQKPGTQDLVESRSYQENDSGWTFIWVDSKSGRDWLKCEGGAYSWNPSSYSDLYWIYNWEVKYAYLVDGHGKRINPYNVATQKCTHN